MEGPNGAGFFFNGVTTWSFWRPSSLSGLRDAIIMGIDK